MSTGRDLISRVRSMNKLLSADNSITDRAIFKELKATGSILIKREANLRRLWQSVNIFTVVPCIKMEQVPLSECCEYKSDCKVSRSVMKIPQISEGIFGLLVQYIMSPGGKEFKFGTPLRFANTLKLKLATNSSMFWIHNDRIYVSDSELEYINLSAYFDSEPAINLYSSCVDNKEEYSCINPLDKDFKIPSYLEDNLVSMVHKKLSETYFRHIEDHTSNNKDENQ